MRTESTNSYYIGAGGTVFGTIFMFKKPRHSRLWRDSNPQPRPCWPVLFTARTAKRRANDPFPSRLNRWSGLIEGKALARTFGSSSIVERELKNATAVATKRRRRILKRYWCQHGRFFILQTSRPHQLSQQRCSYADGASYAAVPSTWTSIPFASTPVTTGATESARISSIKQSQITRG